VLVVVLVLENPDRFAIRLTEQISSIGLFAVTESQCTEDEDEDDSKFRNLGLIKKSRNQEGARSGPVKNSTASTTRFCSPEFSNS
jgi:hypothetical protein